MAGAPKLEVRSATTGDAAAMAQIYEHHVLHGVASYEYEPPPPERFVAKLAELGARGWPFLVAERGRAVVGYAYAAQLRDRVGYRFTCEDSIYVAADATGTGVGTVLLAELIERATALDFKQMVAVIGGAEPASIALHAKLGFREVGRMPAIGFKFGRWLDSVYMQRGLGDAG